MTEFLAQLSAALFGSLAQRLFLVPLLFHIPKLGFQLLVLVPQTLHIRLHGLHRPVGLGYLGAHLIQKVHNLAKALLMLQASVRAC